MLRNTQRGSQALQRDLKAYTYLLVDYKKYPYPFLPYPGHEVALEQHDSNMPAELPVLPLGQGNKITWMATTFEIADEDAELMTDNVSQALAHVPFSELPTVSHVPQTVLPEKYSAATSCYAIRLGADFDTTRYVS